jgi:hypothetical protein
MKKSTAGKRAWKRGSGSKAGPQPLQRPYGEGRTTRTGLRVAAGAPGAASATLPRRPLGNGGRLRRHGAARRQIEVGAVPGGFLRARCRRNSERERRGERCPGPPAHEPNPPGMKPAPPGQPEFAP